MVQEAIEKARVLIEALPYIQRFKGKHVIVKFGGSAMEDRHVADGVLEDVVFLATVGIHPIIVHGGGKAISRAMKQQGIEPRFVAGHRVTDGQALEVVVRVLSGEVNADLVSRCRRCGAQAVPGFRDGRSLLRAGRKTIAVTDSSGAKHQEDIGFVGEIARVDTDALRSMAAEGIVIMPPIGQDEGGQLYNVNADSAAAAIARALEAEKIVFMSDVHGIMERPGDPSTFLSSLDRAKAGDLVESGAISAGMLPKVQACLEAVEGGVRKAHIIDGTLDHALLLEIFTDEGVGTEIIACR